MRDSDAHTSQFSPDTPRKSRPRADLSLSLPPLLVGRARKKQTTSAEKEQQQRRQSPIFSLAQLPIDVGVIIVSKLPVKSKAHLTMLENKELARWVRQGLFEESSSCEAFIETKKEERQKRDGRRKRRRRNEIRKKQKTKTIFLSFSRGNNGRDLRRSFRRGRAIVRESDGGEVRDFGVHASEFSRRVVELFRERKAREGPGHRDGEATDGSETFETVDECERKRVRGSSRCGR